MAGYRRGSFYGSAGADIRSVVVGTPYYQHAKLKNDERDHFPGRKSNFERALCALRNYLNERGHYIFDEPIEELSKIDKEYFYLGNVSESFGKYEIATDEIILD